MRRNVLRMVCLLGLAFMNLTAVGRADFMPKCFECGVRWQDGTYVCYPQFTGHKTCIPVNDGCIVNESGCTTEAD